MAEDQSASRSDGASMVGSPEWTAEQNKRRSDKFSDLFWRFVEPSSTTAEEKELVLYLMEQAVEQERAAIRSELTRSVAVKDMEIIGHREPGDAHKGRAWWSGGTWLQPGEVVAVLTLPKQDERPE